MSNRELIGKIIDKLKSEISILNKILNLQKKKERVIIKGDPVQLEKIVKEEMKFVEENRKIEKERLELVKKFAHLEGINESNITLATLSSYIPEAEHKDFQKIVVELTKTVSEIAKINRTNAELLKNSLDFIEYNINLFMPVKEDVYSSSGKILKTDAVQKRLLDKRV